MKSEFITTPSMERYGFTDFTKTSVFGKLYLEMFQRCLGMRNEHVFNSYKMRMSGAMFEAFAYPYVAGYCANGDKVLTGDETLQYYRQLNPQAKVVVFPFKSKTLENIFVPDGMRINPTDNSVQCVYEYTLRRHDKSQYLDELRKKSKAFKHQKREYRGKFKNEKAKLVFVVTDQFKLPSDMLNDQDIGLIHLPFRFEEWDKFMDYVINRFSFPSNDLAQVRAGVDGLRSHESATLTDAFQNSMVNCQKYLWHPPEYS